MIRHPLDASFNIQAAFKDVEQWLNTLQQEIAKATGVAAPEETEPEPDDRLSDDREVFDGQWTHGHRKHGFELAADGSNGQTITYDKATRKVTVTPVSGSYRFWIDGNLFVKDSAQVSDAHGTGTGEHFLYYDANAQLQWSTSPWSIRDRTVTPVALVYWNSTLSDGVCFYECHTADRVLEFHYNLHFSRGCQYISGYDLSGYTLATNSDAAVTYAIGSGVIADEDIRFVSSAVADGGPYIVFYRSGASGEWLWASYSFPFATGTELQYNQWTGATWQLTNVTPGGTIQYVNYYICATSAVTPQAAQAFLIPGQSVYTSLTAAQAESLQSLSLGTPPFEEVAPLYRVTLQSRNSYGGTHQVQITQITSLKNQTVTVAGGAVGITDHGALTGLGDDDHTQYVLDAGDTMTGALTMTDLGDTTPVITFAGDPNTGIAYESADQFVLLANGAAQLRVGNGYITTVGTHYFTDSNFNAYISSSNPIFTWDSTDYFTYIRSSNELRLVIGNAAQFYFYSDGQLTTAGAISPANTSNWYLGLNSGNPIISFDAGDYILYAKTNNYWQHIINNNYAAVLTEATTPSTTPTGYWYAKPIALGLRGDTVASWTYTGGNTYVWPFDSVDYDSSSGKLYTATCGGVANAGVYISEAGYYRWSVSVSANIPASTGRTVYVTRGSSSATSEYIGMGFQHNENASTARTRSINISGTNYFNAGDYFAVSTSVNAAPLDDNWGHMYIERIN